MNSTDLDGNGCMSHTNQSSTHAPSRMGRLFGTIEALALFALGFGLMLVFYGGTVSSPGAEIGVPGHDSFYHIAMASILTKYGAMSQFPWLEYVYFRDQGTAFVSHHWGFHVMLMPFVKLAELTTGDALEGGRWATSTFFGLNLVVFHFLLRLKRVPMHWLWIGLFFLLPDQFYARHGFVRAIGPSLLFMQLTLLALFARRYWLAGLAVGAYVHLYLGAVMFGPLLVAIHAAALALGPKGDREWPWKMVALTAGGWALGVVTYPYAGGMYEFLKLQVFGSGLSPDIEVGREWKPYSDAWFLVRMAGPLLAVWVAALVLRFRTGPRLSATDTTLLVLQFLFLVLTVKARRFIEYWPPICLLSAAYMAASPLSELAGAARNAWARRRGAQPGDGDAIRSGGGAIHAGVIGAAVLALVAASGFAWYRVASEEDAALLLRHWAVWAVPVLVVAGVCATRALNRAADGLELPFGTSAAGRIAFAGLAAVLIPGATLAIGAGSLSSAVGQLRCYYDLDEVRSMMAYLENHSDAGDLVFTDDWDVFPLYFFHNRHNHYIVGLDPKFTHQREPDLWNRYVKISRGKVPSTIRLASATDGSEQATVDLEDIREAFGARWVVVDDDHSALSDALAHAPEFAELVYPEGMDYDAARRSEYVIFRIRSEEEERQIAGSKRDLTAPLYLSDLRAVSVAQGWGDLAVDRTVDGNDIRLGGEEFARGLGTHAPCTLVYDIPEGQEFFEAVVGVDDETEGRGSVIASVSLDGELMYETTILRGRGEPVELRIPVGGATRIELGAEPTEDGQRFDHVSWADARFLRSPVETAVP